MAGKDDSEESSSDVSEDEKIADFQEKVKLTSPQKEFRFDLNQNKTQILY